MAITHKQTKGAVMDGRAYFSLLLRPVAMQLCNLEASFRYVLVDEAHSLDPVGKNDDFWGNALSLGCVLHNTSKGLLFVDTICAGMVSLRSPVNDAAETKIVTVIQLGYTRNGIDT